MQPICRYVLISIFIMLPLAVCASNQKIQGAWELIDLSAVSLMDSPPDGFPSQKYCFKEDGKLYMVGAEETVTPHSEFVPYSFSDNFLTLEVPGRPPVRVAVEFLTSEKLILVYGERERWTFRRINEPLAENKLIEPRSVVVLQSKDPKDQLTNLDITYDIGDYSNLSLSQRITGVWEATAYKNVPRQAAPPYGFPNNKYVFTEDGRFYILGPSETSVAEKPNITYIVSDKTVKTKGPEGKELAMQLSFNTWGQLVLEWQGVTQTFKLLSKDASKIQVLPAKICFLEVK